MNGRVQDAVTGRFLSADPFVPEQTNNQAFNRYSYVYNNPMTFVDPTGFITCPDDFTGLVNDLPLGGVSIGAPRAPSIPGLPPFVPAPMRDFTGGLAGTVRMAQVQEALSRV